MKILLKELINPNTVILNDTQKAVLLITHIAPTPKVAFENSVVSQNLAKAQDGLIKLNMLHVVNNEQRLTDSGEEMLKHHNLVDEMGELTDDANEILERVSDVSDTFNNVTEEFKFLSSLQ